MITLHHLRRSRSHRVLWLLEELGLAYELICHDRDPKTQRAPPALAAIHPLGHAPVLIDRAAGGTVTIAESGASVSYLIERYGDGRLAPAPGDWVARAAYEEWLHFAEGTAMPPLVASLVGSLTGGLPPGLAGFTGQAIAGAIRQLELGLGERDWLLGEFSGADVQISYVIESMRQKRLLEAHPSLTRYLERMEDRPAYRRALAKGGPVALAL